MVMFLCHPKPVCFTVLYILLVTKQRQKTKKLVNKWTHHSVQIGVTKKVKSGHVQSEWGSGKRSGWL